MAKDGSASQADRVLAPWACRAAGARLFGEPEDPLRAPHRRDCDRIVRSTAFRRLQGKTQVFLGDRRDHVRNRLTHTLEVARVARTIARALALDEDLAEAAALAHDLGHSPFGHAGERALDGRLRASGGFDHNLQAFRLLTRLESRYATFDGLNLCFSTLEACVKHNGPCAPAGPLADYPALARLRLAEQATLEAQAAAIADDIAYCCHDFDDGLRAGFFALDEASSAPILGDLLARLDAEHPAIETARRCHEIVRRTVGVLVRDVVETSRATIEARGLRSVEDVRAQPEPSIRFSPPTAHAVETLRAFLRERMYMHPEIVLSADRARAIVEDLFDALLDRPELMPEDWRSSAAEPNSTFTAGVVRDYIAGMTDRFAISVHRRLIGSGGAADLPEKALFDR